MSRIHDTKTINLKISKILLENAKVKTTPKKIKVFSAVTVDSEYEIPNGLSGMKRDVILHLCNFFWYNLKKIKNIIGICFEHFFWIRHRLFVENRPKEIPACFRTNPLLGFNVTCTPDGPLCEFTADSYRTVFLNSVMSEGVFNWTVKVRFAPDKHSSCCIGAAPPSLLAQLEDVNLGEDGTASFYFAMGDEGPLGSTLFGVACSDIPLAETKVPANACVAVELDCTACTMCFFVNEKKVPRAVSGVHGPLHFGLSGYECPSFISLSFRRLPSASPSPVVCKHYAARWRTE